MFESSKTPCWIRLGPISGSYTRSSSRHCGTVCERSTSIIAPHGVLHYVPFHALFDGKKYLTDSFTISYAPSASIYSFCHRRKSTASGPPLVLGVPDLRAPSIHEEVQSAARALSGATLVLGAEAGEEALRTKGVESRLIHIATHGTFRQDNPMFSGIRLGTSYLNLYDLYQLKLEAELVTLSGCATGLNVVAAGDELLGLIRGLLHAGARSSSLPSGMSTIRRRLNS